jgi:hypothetical protein
MSGEPAVEIFADRFADADLDTRTERIADIHVFSRYAQGHMKTDLPCSDINFFEFILVAGAHKLHGGSAADIRSELSG